MNHKQGCQEFGPATSGHVWRKKWHKTFCDVSLDGDKSDVLCKTEINPYLYPTKPTQAIPYHTNTSIMLKHESCCMTYPNIPWTCILTKHSLQHQIQPYPTLFYPTLPILPYPTSNNLPHPPPCPPCSSSRLSWSLLTGPGSSRLYRAGPALYYTTLL